jgi:citrate synthase
MSKETFTIIDNRTGKQYEVPVEYSTIKANSLRQIKVDADEFGMMTYDPGYDNTASCKSRITYIDGDKGILRYRGYPIEQLGRTEHVSGGRLPAHLWRTADKEQLANWEFQIMHHTFLHENMTELFRAFRYDAHPMGMMISALAFMSTLHKEAAASKMRMCV